MGGWVETECIRSLTSSEAVLDKFNKGDHEIDKTEELEFGKLCAF